MLIKYIKKPSVGIEDLTAAEFRNVTKKDITISPIIFFTFIL